MILGIDLGTSNSMAAVYKGGQAVLIKSRTGSHLIPSVVSMDENGVFYTGDMAKRRKHSHPENTVDMFKRSMGTEKTFSIGEKEIRAEELSAVLLKSIKEDAQRFLGQEIKNVVISVPAFFLNSQRKAVIRAGELAGFQVRKIVNEPTAAAIAYGIQNMDPREEADKGEVILVLDLGGGTFDISVLEVTGSVMEVVAICGDNQLGGGDFTRRLMELFQKANSIERELEAREEAALWNQAQRAKHQITEEGFGKMKCVIGNVEYTYAITEAEYEKACMDLLEKIRKLTLEAIEESKYEPDEIDEIIMVGGGTRLSIVKKMIEKMAGRKLDYRINPDEAVAVGTAMQGALLEKDKDIKDLVMTDICPHYIGFETRDKRGSDLLRVFDVVIPKNTAIPARGSVVHTTHPGRVSNAIWQSEDRDGIRSSVLGEIHFVRPVLGNRHVAVQKNITYDING
ncbi:MAG: Hsp70 family protein, partial [Lachnospiraceae bacterium]|nr:Hsp70 family protein [Lachnospiraceae bacterium]